MNGSGALDTCTNNGTEWMILHSADVGRSSAKKHCKSLVGPPSLSVT